MKPFSNHHNRFRKQAQQSSFSHNIRLHHWLTKDCLQSEKQTTRSSFNTKRSDWSERVKSRSGICAPSHRLCVNCHLKIYNEESIENGKRTLLPRTFAQHYPAILLNIQSSAVFIFSRRLGCCRYLLRFHLHFPLHPATPAHECWWLHLYRSIEKQLML